MLSHDSFSEKWEIHVSQVIKIWKSVIKIIKNRYGDLPQISLFFAKL